MNLWNERGSVETQVANRLAGGQQCCLRLFPPCTSILCQSACTSALQTAPLVPACFISNVPTWPARNSKDTRWQHSFASVQSHVDTGRMVVQNQTGSTFAVARGQVVWWVGNAALDLAAARALAADLRAGGTVIRPAARALTVLAILANVSFCIYMCRCLSLTVSTRPVMNFDLQAALDAHCGLLEAQLSYA